MANKGRIRMLLSFSCFLVLMGHSYSQRDKLLQGGELKDGDELVSASGKFKLGFFTPSKSPKSSKRYIGVWYHKLKDRTSQYPQKYPWVRYYTPQFQSPKVVWIANRNTPILHKSATLRIDSSDGNLKIFPNGENPIAITSVEAARNTSVTLQQSGNLVLHELHSNGSIKEMLWQSFDYPSDTLLPEMKLGINLKTGHKWFLQSWLTDDSPAQGRYTVGMDPNVTNQLTVWWRGEIKGTSGHLLNGQFKSWYARGYNFSYTSNEQEKYFSYSVSEDITSYPMLQIDWDGSLVDDRGESIGSCSVFDEYCGSDGSHRMCSSVSSYFVSNNGFMSGGGIKFRESDNMTLADCRQKCYKNCSCVAYAATNRANDTGCEVWSRGTEFIESYDGNNREIYVESEESLPPGFAKKKWWIGLLIAVAVALLVILLCSLSYLARRKYKRKEEKRWQSLMVVLLVPVLCYFCYLAGRKLMAEDTLWQGRELKELISDFGKLKLGIFGLPSTTNRYVGIWYNKGGEEPQNLSLEQSGNLLLSEWKASGSTWQSFDYPTDTLLPDMKLGINLQTGQQWFLKSWRTRRNNPAEGSFIFRMTILLSQRFISKLDDVNSFISCQYPTCGVEELPECRGNHLGFMSGDGMKFKENDDMILRDCELKCLNSCSCVAYAVTDEENEIAKYTFKLNPMVNLQVPN
ncbi:hypothetical protein EZV62_004003 [Acer yangbiense]|uniref:Apple domain-containing protein n=1 Tax=Acer yangbiense TaxID=1000413 RepID=A0A5C7IIV2_9ROSI|nr:hypothetical protein EZV62_004003 [Acer yangbiense]